MASVMEAASFGTTSALASGQGKRLSSSGAFSKSVLAVRARRTTTRRRNATALTVAKVATDLKEQMQEYAAAEKRWLKQVSEGKVKALTPKEAGYSYQLADNVLLDVRPSFERNKGWVKDSVWVPAFETDKSLSPGVLYNKVILFLFGGWWSGNQVTKRNERFMVDVAAKIPKTANIIVGCQRGLRSLAACEHLYKAGYRNLSWIKGGFDAAEEEDFKREGPEALKFAGLGGFSEFIGLTDPQRQRAQKEGLGYRALFWGRIAGILIGFDLIFLAFQSLSPGQ